MNLTQDNLRKIPVFSDADERFLGYVLDVIVDIEKTRFLGLLIRKKIFRPKKAVPFSAILGIAKDHIVVEQGKTRWLPLYIDMWRAKFATKPYQRLVAIQESKEVGKVADFVADDDGNVILLVVEPGLLSKLRYVPRRLVDNYEDGVFTLQAGAMEKTEKEPQWPKLVERTTSKLAKAAGRTTAKAIKKLKKKKT
jgi:uncharacterized protein YrrD